MFDKLYDPTLSDFYYLDMHQLQVFDINTYNVLILLYNFEYKSFNRKLNNLGKQAR